MRLGCVTDREWGVKENIVRVCFEEENGCAAGM
jgi:hypothetical protein